MERERFLDAVALRLGRARLSIAPARPAHTAAWPTVEGSLSARFVTELKRVGGTVSRADSLDDVQRALREAITASGDAPTIAAARAEFEAWGLDTTKPLWDRVSFFGDKSLDTGDAFRQVALTADLGITLATSAVASTGTLILTATQTSPRSCSLLPRRHLALIRETQIVADLGVALVLGAPGVPSRSEMPSAVLCITGPSRTSDIENDLSIGVHGPAEVHVIVYSESLSQGTAS